MSCVRVVDSVKDARFGRAKVPRNDVKHAGSEWRERDSNGRLFLGANEFLHSRILHQRGRAILVNLTRGKSDQSRSGFRPKILDSIYDREYTIQLGSLSRTKMS